MKRVDISLIFTYQNHSSYDLSQLLKLWVVPQRLFNFSNEINWQ